MPENGKTFMVEDAQLIFRNFSGREGPYNRNGDSSFCIILDPEVASVMAADGWSVKMLKPREDGDDPTPYIEVGVRFDIRPPQITLLTSGGRVMMNADTMGQLDFADLTGIDVIARAYNWEFGDKSGCKAYLQTMFATLNENELEKKYAVAQPGEEG